MVDKQSIIFIRQVIKILVNSITLLIPILSRKSPSQLKTFRRTNVDVYSDMDYNKNPYQF